MAEKKGGEKGEEKKGTMISSEVIVLHLGCLGNFLRCVFNGPRISFLWGWQGRGKGKKGRKEPHQSSPCLWDMREH